TRLGQVPDDAARGAANLAPVGDGRVAAVGAQVDALQLRLGQGDRLMPATEPGPGHRVDPVRVEVDVPRIRRGPTPRRSGEVDTAVAVVDQRADPRRRTVRRLVTRAVVNTARAAVARRNAGGVASRQR